MRDAFSQALGFRRGHELLNFILVELRRGGLGQSLLDALRDAFSQALGFRRGHELLLDIARTGKFLRVK